MRFPNKNEKGKKGKSNLNVTRIKTFTLILELRLEKTIAIIKKTSTVE